MQKSLCLSLVHHGWVAGHLTPILLTVTTEVSWIVHVIVAHLLHRCCLLLCAYVSSIHSHVRSEASHVIVVELLGILMAQQAAKIV